MTESLSSAAPGPPNRRELNRLLATLESAVDSTLSPRELAVGVQTIADTVERVDDEQLRAGFVHAAVLLVFDNCSVGRGDSKSAELHSQLIRLLTLHADVAEHLDVNDLAHWLGSNYAAEDDRPQVTVGPYLDVLGPVGITLLLLRVEEIERFTAGAEGPPARGLSISAMLRREIALHTADTEAILREFGGALQDAEDFLGVSRAFQLVDLPLQAEVFARRGARLAGSSGLACRMIALEYSITRDPLGSLPEIEKALIDHPTREVAGMVRRAIGERWQELSGPLAEVVAHFSAPERTECAAGLGLPA